MSKTFEPIQILRLLAEHHVDAIVVGGVAGTLAGLPLATFHLDLVYSLEPANLFVDRRALRERRRREM